MNNNITTPKNSIVKLKVIASICIIFCAALSGWSQNGVDISKKLVKTWYKVKVGDIHSHEMFPSEKEEVLFILADGVLKVKERNNVIQGKWEYIEDSQKLKSTFDYNGNEYVSEAIVQELSDHKLLITMPDKNLKIEYKDTPPDPKSKKVRKAPFVTNSVSTIDAENWTGLHPFNHKIITSKDGDKARREALGVLVLLKNNGKPFIRINEDGLTTDIEITEGTKKDSEIHYTLITDDSNFAGEVIFREDNSSYFYRKADGALIEYLKDE